MFDVQPSLSSLFSVIYIKLNYSLIPKIFLLLLGSILKIRTSQVIGMVLFLGFLFLDCACFKQSMKLFLVGKFHKFLVGFSKDSYDDGW